MLYGTEVWLKPPDFSSKASQRTMSKMATVQRQAAPHATGALAMTPNEVLNAHANLPPIEATVHQVLQQSTLRLAMLAKTHPLTPYVRRASKRYVKAHRSPLHELFDAYKIRPERMEKIKNVRKGPRYEPSFRIKIAKDKDAAKRWAEANEAEYQIFSDRSVIEGQVGVAAVLYLNGILQSTLRYHLGLATEYGIAEAELVGEVMAAYMLSRLWQRYEEATIGVDNTATLYNTRNQKPRGAHYLLDSIHDLIDTAIEKGPTGREIAMIWTPGHVGIEGNKKGGQGG
jgi:hypothetical protein